LLLPVFGCRVQQQAAQQEQQLQQFKAALKGEGSSSSAKGQNWALLKQQLLSSLNG
jgi:hypothetical protein